MQKNSEGPKALLKRQTANNLPFYLMIAVVFPALFIPLFVAYIPADTLVENGYGLVIINEYQKYAAELFSLGVALGTGLLFLLKMNKWAVTPKILQWGTLLFMLAIGLSLFQAIDLERAVLVGLQVYFLPVLFFLVVVILRWTLTQGMIIICLSLFAATIVSIIGIAQGFEMGELAKAFPHAGAGSLLFYQNLAGEYLVILIPVALAIVLMPIHPSLRILAGFVTLLLTTHLIMTLARGAWVGLLGGLFVGVTLTGVAIYKGRRCGEKDGTESDPRTFRKWLHLLILGLATTMLLITCFAITQNMGQSFSGSPYIQELTSINLKNTTGRLQIWSDSLQMLEKSWLTGVGPGHYKSQIPLYFKEIPTVSYLFRWDVKTGALTTPFRPHNDYLQTWLELGLAGVVGMIWLFIAIAWIATKGIVNAYQSKDKVRGLIILGTFCGFAAWTVCMLFEFPFRMPASLIAGWLCAGLAVSFSLPGLPEKTFSLPPVARQMTALLSLVIVIGCFMFAHQQFWSDVYFNQSITAGNAQNIQQSYAWIEKAYNYARWKEQAISIKSRQELLLRKPEAALLTTREGLRRNPNSLPILWANGLAAGALGYEEESREAFQKIVTLFPFLPEIEKYRQFAKNSPNKS